jgi:hypothetical protein
VAQILPSPEARQIFNMMVVRADDNNGELHLTLANSIALSATLQRKGEDSQARSAMTELCEAAWIAPGDDGGWLLT